MFYKAPRLYSSKKTIKAILAIGNYFTQGLLCAYFGKYKFSRSFVRQKSFFLENSNLQQVLKALLL